MATEDSNLPESSKAASAENQVLPAPRFDDADPRFRPVPRTPVERPAPVLPTFVRQTSQETESLITTSTHVGGGGEEEESDTRTLASTHTLASLRRPDSPDGSDDDSKKGDTRVQKGVLHWVTSSDTLPGLALRYSVSVASIRTANNLFSGSGIFERGYLLIPVTNYTGPAISERSEQDERKALVKRFQLSSKCVHPDEALAYMVKCDYDLDAALENYWSDARWERENPFGGWVSRCNVRAR